MEPVIPFNELSREICIIYIELSTTFSEICSKQYEQKSQKVPELSTTFWSNLFCS